MSGVDSEQDKQPISSVNGQTSDNGTVSPKKDGNETETTAVVSCQSEATESKKDNGDKDETKDSQSPEIITNGESAEGHENGEVSEKVEESSVVENKPDETPEEVIDSKQGNDVVEVGIGSEVVEAEKEVEKAAEESIPEKSNVPAATSADAEQSKVETAPEDVEKTDRELKEGVKVADKQTEEQSENQPSEESKVSVTGKDIHVSL